MARLYRRPQRGNVFYIDLKDARGIRRGVKGYPSKRHTEELARRLEQLRDARQTGAPLSPDASRWLETQPPERLRHFADLGFLAPDAAATGQPLRTLAADWIAALVVKSRDERYLFQNRRHVEGVLDDAGFVYWHDVTPVRIDAALDAYVARDGLSARTRNARLVAFRGFNRWCKKQGRALADHTATLELADVRTDRRRVRRALPPEHLTRLLDAARGDEGVVYGLTGPERALVYLTAASTGWRWSELRRLRRMDFRLNATPPYLAPPASTQKAGREDTVPLRADVATALRDYFAAHPLPPEAAAFPMPKSNAGAKFLRHDLARTGDDEATAAAKTARGETPVAPIPYRDAHGEVADFHALRHTLATMLGDAKTDVKSAQTILRHSDPALTLNIYTHTKRENQAAALEALPSLLPPVPAPEAVPTMVPASAPDDDDNPPPKPHAPNTGGDGGAKGDAPTAGTTGPMDGNGVEGGVKDKAQTGKDVVGAGQRNCPIGPEMSPSLGVKVPGMKRSMVQGDMEPKNLLTQWNGNQASSFQPSRLDHPARRVATPHGSPPCNAFQPISKTTVPESGRAPGLIWSDIHRQKPASAENQALPPPTPADVITHEKRSSSEEVDLVDTWHPLRDSNPCSQTENLMC